MAVPNEGTANLPSDTSARYFLGLFRDSDGFFYAPRDSGAGSLKVALYNSTGSAILTFTTGGNLKTTPYDANGNALIVPNRTTTAAHLTVTGLWGAFPPSSTEAAWISNTNNSRQKIRFYPQLVARGCTAFNDDPLVTMRAYLKNGTSVCDTSSIQRQRPRLTGNTKIKCQKTINNGAAYTDYSANVVDGSAATTADLSSLDTVANGDWGIIGGPAPFIGAALNITAANANAATMTVEYWNGSAWAAVSNLTDGTASGGATLAVDGQISWDLPSDWASSTINSIAAFWVRISVSAALDATVTVEEIDLLFPITAGIDVDTDGDDAMLCIESQDQSVTGTMAYSGTVVYSWRY